MTLENQGHAAVVIASNLGQPPEPPTFGPCGWRRTSVPLPKHVVVNTGAT